MNIVAWFVLKCFLQNANSPAIDVLCTGKKDTTFNTTWFNRMKTKETHSFLGTAEWMLPYEIRNAAVRNINKLAIIFSSPGLFQVVCWDRCASLDTRPATEHVQTRVVGFLNLSSMVTTWISAGQTKNTYEAAEYVSSIQESCVTGGGGCCQSLLQK